MAVFTAGGNNQLLAHRHLDLGSFLLEADGEPVQVVVLAAAALHVTARGHELGRVDDDHVEAPVTLADLPQPVDVWLFQHTTNTEEMNQAAQLMHTFRGMQRLVG